MGEQRRVDARDLTGLIDGWAAGTGPLYRLLGEALASAIARGDLPAGTRLPAERALADALPAARGTVVAALGLLVERGLVERRQGSGSTVRGPRSGPRPELAAGLRAQTVTGRPLREPDSVRGRIDLGLSVIDDTDGLPPEAFAVDPRTLARAGAGHGYAPLGIAPLRERIAALLTDRGFATTRHEIAITLGAQHGIALAAALLTRAGDRVAIEDPGYPGAIDAYSRAGCAFTPVATDRGGIQPTSLGAALDARPHRVVHLSPGCASPTGTTTAASRVADLAALLERSPAWLVEDAALEFLAGATGNAYLAAARPERSVLVGSVSKVLWGGLRVGWMRAPADLVARVGRARAAQDLGSAIAPQVTVLRLLDDLERIETERRAAAEQRRQRLHDGLSSIPSLASFPCAPGGLSLWVPVGDAHRFHAAAASVGVDVVPGPVCSVSNRWTDRVRVSAWASPSVLDEAVSRLATVF